LEMNSFLTLHSFLEVGKTQDLSSKFWQTLGDALSYYAHCLLVNSKSYHLTFMIVDL
jgi:hypothetical protein